jgi:general secretion pathway protein D
VGDEVAVVTQTSSTPNAIGSTSISNSVTYRPTGIILEVTPVISASGRVALTVSQEVSSVQAVGSTVGGVTYPNFSKRKVSTEVVVEDGKPLLIAGLIRDSGNNSVTGLPGLKDIPVLGGLFGSTKKVREKTELIISITSFIVNGKGDAERVSAQFENALKQLKPLLKSNSMRGSGNLPEETAISGQVLN